MYLFQGLSVAKSIRIMQPDQSPTYAPLTGRQRANILFPVSEETPPQQDQHQQVRTVPVAMARHLYSGPIAADAGTAVSVTPHHSPSAASKRRSCSSSADGPPLESSARYVDVAEQGQSSEDSEESSVGVTNVGKRKHEE